MFVFGAFAGLGMLEGNIRCWLSVCCRSATWFPHHTLQVICLVGLNHAGQIVQTDLVVAMLRLVSCASRLGLGMIKRIVLVFAIGWFCSFSAQAFEKAGTSGAGKPGVTATDAVGLSEKAAAETKSADRGLIIPGLGALGVLPKLDFGLELLYGENQPQVLEPEDNDVESDGLRIKGTLKHRF